MALVLWNTHRLAVAIAEKQLSPDEKFRYLLFSYCMYAASGYLAAIFIVPSSGWLFWYECFLVLVVTYFGLLRCRARYEGAVDDRLLENCVLLGVPLGLKLIIFTWIAHISTGWGMQWFVSHATLTNERSIAFVNFLLKTLHTFYPFLIAAIGLILYFWRLSIHLDTTAMGAKAPNTPVNPDAPTSGAPVT